MDHSQFQKRYLQQEILGQGSYGIVYSAKDTQEKGRLVAIKRSPVRPNEQYNLKHEVELVSQTLRRNHPNIAYYEVPCYRYNTTMGDYDFGILEYYSKGNLEQLLAKSQLSKSQKEDIANQILDGICFFHEAKIIHRDLKPSNILIQIAEKGRVIPKIADFGIGKEAKKTAEWERSQFHNTRASGTLSFAAPEQLKSGELNYNTDLWSYGVLVYYLFTGELPYNMHDSNALDKLQRGDIAPRVQELPEPFQTIVRRCLVFEQQQRVQSAMDLKVLLNSNIEIEEVPPHQHPQKGIRQPSPVPQKSDGFISKLLPILFIGLFFIGIGIYRVETTNSNPPKQALEHFFIDPFVKIRADRTAQGYTCYDPKNEMMRFYDPKTGKQSFVDERGSRMEQSFDSADDFKNDEARVFVQTGKDKNGKPYGKYFDINKTGQCIRGCN